MSDSPGGDLHGRSVLNEMVICTKLPPRTAVGILHHRADFARSVSGKGRVQKGTSRIRGKGNARCRGYRRVPPSLEA